MGTDSKNNDPVTLPYASRDLGVTVLGQTGYGKTTLLEQLICQDIAQGTSVIVVDAHGDLTQRILTLADADEDDLLLVEAWEDAPFRLNLFDCPDPTSSIAVDRTVSGIVQVFKKLFGSPREFYPRLERDLGNAARTVLATGGTLLDVPRLFWDGEVRAAALAQVTNPRVHEFWQRWEQIGRPDRQLEQLESTINRLDQFLGSEFVAQVVGSPTSTIPFDEVLGGDGRVLLLNLPVGEIGEGLCNLLGALFLAVLSERIFARGKLAREERPRVHLYLDEYGRYATPTTAQLLTEGRKFGVGTTIAHQTRAQIPDEENRAAELQVGSLICFQLIGADAAELAGEFHVTPEPQWEEPVEEIEGEEPELAVPPDPVEHLLKSGHPDPLIRKAVRTFLKPHFDSGYKTIDDKSNMIPMALADAMEQRITYTPGEVLTVLRIHYWREFVGYFLPDLYEYPAAAKRSLLPAFRDFDYMRSPERVQREEHLYRCVQDYVQAADAIVVAGQDPDGGPHEGRLLAELEKIYNWYRPFRWGMDPYTGEDTRPINPRRGCEYPLEPRDPTGGAQKWLNDFCKRLGWFVYPLLILMHRLAAEPLLVPTGRVRPRKRIRYITHPQRSYQDVQNELAVELASLPRFTALCNLEGEQHRVRLAAPVDAPIDQARIERVRAASKKRFGRDEEPPPAEESGPSGPGPAPSRVAGAGRSRPIGRRSARGDHDG